MAARKQSPRKEFTVAQANAMLPLLRAILRDVTVLARELRERHERLVHSLPPDRTGMDTAHREELEGLHAELQKDQERMREYLRELEGLGVELKDFDIGLVDFPGRMDGRLVYLCWRLGEPEVMHWHELEAGFKGRQPLLAAQAAGGKEHGDAP